ncbi:MAG: hypothetical protein HYY17_07685 [Planctomycetes bacterium]|nr:hypothetical protein [Planctomycetota bacterium]
MESHQLETFALAKDRAKALEQLIPGTEEYYFHSCLLHEQNGNVKEIDATLQQWIKRYDETPLVREIQNRRALLRYDSDPKRTLEHLRRRLDLEFNHERAAEGRKTKYPTKLDPALIARDAVKERGLSHSNSSDLSGFTDAALEWLAAEPMDGERLRHFLSRLRRPDCPNLVDLVLAELKDPHSEGFGSIPIHNLLLEEQLEKFASRRKDLMEADEFVHARIVKLQPGPDVDWQNNAPDREAYLTRLWDFVKGLSPKFDSLKAHVLFHRLDHDRRLGVYDPARFLEYVKLPRRVSYANPDYLKQFRDESRPFDLGTDVRNVTLHPPFSSDEELVRDYLSRFFLGAKDAKAYEPFIRAPFLREVFATTKILAGAGDMEQWYSMLNDPAAYQAIKDRVEIAFACTNRTWFGAKEPVALEVDVKNVPTLVVKVFEINTLNYFLANGRDVDTSVDLDGLVAGEEKTYSYEEPPARRVRRKFDFPALSKPGVYVVEFLGGGISSRALVRKGRLRFVENVGSAGHVFAVLDEDRNHLKDASIWLGGREYAADEAGEIRVPFSTNPGREKILLRHGDLTTVEEFHHRAESYAFTAGIYVDRESLLKRREAQVVVRASLRVNGAPASIELLDEPTLTIVSADHDGVCSSSEVRDFKLHEDRESTHTFQVPDNLATISFTLKGKVQSLSQGKKIDLEDSRTYSLNGIDREEAIEDIHLARTAAGYVAVLAGKSGEPRPHVPLNVSISHRDITSTIDVTIETDDEGRVELGDLRDVTRVSLAAPGGVSESWSPPRDRCRRAGAVHARAGETVRIPFFDELARSDVSLLERIGSTFVRDRFAAVARKDGFLEIAGLPAGNYDLRLKCEEADIAIRIAAGEDRNGWIAGEKRHLERTNPRPLQMADVKIGKDDLRIAIADAGAETRVHVFGTRFLPAHSAFDDLAGAGTEEPGSVELFKGPSNYVSGRDIGDEYRYILERKYATRFAGNMLARPGLLLNPWAVRSTQTATQEAATGEGYAACPAAAPCEAMLSAADEQDAPAGAGPRFANLDFLAHPAALLLNLKPGADGTVTIPREALAHANQARVVAVDGPETVCRDVLLPEVKSPHQDLRLKLGLDPDRHFTEKQQITVLAEGKPLEIADITTSKVELYDTLARVYRLFATLSNDANLATFGFILRWPKMSEEEKRAKYGEFACHELNFFLSRKDPEFFQRAVQPYLRNKKDRTFLDRYLVEEGLSAYRNPWAFGRLNIVERILLAQRFDDEGDPVARHAGDLNDLSPRDVERSNRLFQSAIQGSALEAGDALGIKGAAAEAEEERVMKSEVADLMMSAGKPAASMPPPSPRKMMEKRDEAGSEKEKAAGPGGGRGARDRRREMEARGGMRQFYRTLDKTQEWAENNYYRLTIDRQGPDLVTINPFWRDYAKHRQGPFLSPNVAYASRNFTEMMFALSVLDLPFDAEKPAVAFEGAAMKLSGKTRSIAFHKEIKPAEPAAERVPVLVSQNYFRLDDRYRYEGDEQVEKYVTGEFLANVVYVAQVVLTNPTSGNQKLDLLMQIPTGAVPVRNGFQTRGRHLELASYATESIEYAFYFPAPGTFTHFPVHVAKNERLVASAEPARLKVVREPSAVDRTAWAWISQDGDDAEVFRWLETNNVDRIASTDGDGHAALELVAWRMKERGFYEKLIAILRRRHVYNGLLWSYSVHHDDAPNIREFLLHQDGFLEQCGLALEGALLRIDPIECRRYQHLEYAPLVNARTQKLGARRKILNDRLGEQYAHLMNVLRYRAKLSDEERLAVAYYLFLQDRIDEGLETFEGVDPAKIESKLQYDYLKVYAELCRERPDAAKEIAAPYKDYPVDRWRDLFRNALAQIEEISGASARVVDDKDRDQRQAKLAATEPDFDFAVEKKTVTVNFQNLSAVRVNYYRMDVELLFSRQPFVQRQSGQFAFVRPNRSEEVKLPAGRNAFSFDLPSEFHGANVVVELVAEGKRKSQAYYAHELAIQLVENYGQVRVTRQGTERPLAKTYVKAYARMKDGEVKFYKDGYTDLRGIFDYASLSTDELERVERFSMLILHEEAGAVIREAAAPKR